MMYARLADTTPHLGNAPSDLMPVVPSEAASTFLQPFFNP